MSEGKVRVISMVLPENTPGLPREIIDALAATLNLGAEALIPEPIIPAEHVPWCKALADSVRLVDLEELEKLFARTITAHVDNLADGADVEDEDVAAACIRVLKERLVG